MNRKIITHGLFALLSGLGAATWAASDLENAEGGLSVPGIAPGGIYGSGLKPFNASASNAASGRMATPTHSGDSSSMH